MFHTANKEEPEKKRKKVLAKERIREENPKEPNPRYLSKNDRCLYREHDSFLISLVGILEFRIPDMYNYRRGIWEIVWRREM